MIVLIAALLIVVVSYCLAWVTRESWGWQPMEVKPLPSQPWWSSPPYSVSWNGRRFPQESDDWPWWRPGE